MNTEVQEGHELAALLKVATDEQLGRLLLEQRLLAEAEAQGVAAAERPVVIEQRRADWVARLSTQEAESVEHVALEKALRLACSGEFARAGALFRALMFDSASRQVERKHAVNALTRLGQLHRAGAKGAGARRAYTDEQRAEWRRIAVSEEMQGHSAQRKAELIARRMDHPDAAVETIRKAISRKENG